MPASGGGKNQYGQREYARDGRPRLGLTRAYPGGRGSGGRGLAGGGGWRGSGDGYSARGGAGGGGRGGGAFGSGFGRGGGGNGSGGGGGAGALGRAQGSAFGSADWQTPAESAAESDRIDALYGYSPFVLDGPARSGWLANVRTCSLTDPESGRVSDAIHCYLVEPSGARFRATVAYDPYLFVLARPGHERELEAALRRRFGRELKAVEAVRKEDLALPNHLSGTQASYLKLTFNGGSHQRVRRALLDAVKRAQRAPSAGVLGETGEAAQLGDFAAHIQARARRARGRARAARVARDSTRGARRHARRAAAPAGVP